IFKANPFASVDQTGVGKLMKIALDDGRRARPGLKVGICGEHGGDPLTIDFCHRIGLNYVSCSPFRVPIARLAAAQAALKESQSVKGSANGNGNSSKKASRSKSTARALAHA